MDVAEHSVKLGWPDHHVVFDCHELSPRNTFKKTRNISRVVKHLVLCFLFISIQTVGSSHWKWPGLKYHYHHGQEDISVTFFSTAEFILRIWRIYLLIKGFFFFLDHISEQSLSSVSSLRNVRLWFEMFLWDSHDHSDLISCFGVWWPHAWRSQGVAVFCALLCLHLYSGWWKELSLPIFIS